MQAKQRKQHQDLANFMSVLLCLFCVVFSSCGCVEIRQRHVRSRSHNRCVSFVFVLLSISFVFCFHSNRISVLFVDSSCLVGIVAFADGEVRCCDAMSFATLAVCMCVCFVCFVCVCFNTLYCFAQSDFLHCLKLS